jgi:hypothetical protein
MVRAVVVFTRQQLYCPTAVSLFGWLFPQQGRAIRFEYYPLFHETNWGIYNMPCFGGWFFALPLLSAFVAFPVFIHWEFSTGSSAPCPTPVLQGRFSIPPPPLMSVLEYSLLFCFSVLLGGFSLPRGALDYIPGEWVGDSNVVCAAHLFILQIHARSFETSWWGEMGLLCSMA